MQWMNNNFLKVFLATVILSSLTGCSFRQVAMNYHEFFATRAASRFFDLNSTQKDMFKEKWKSFSQRTLAPKVETLALNLKSISSSKDPLMMVSEVQSLGSEVMIEACTEFAPLMASLSSDQIEYFKEKLEERNSKFDPEKHGGLSKYRKIKHKESIDNIKDWLGHVSQAQKELLVKLDAKKDELTSGAWESQYLDYSKDAQTVFSSFLSDHRGDSQKLGEACRQFSLMPEKFLMESSRQFKEKLTAFRQHSVKEWKSSIEPEQREHLLKETRKLSQELLSWSALLNPDS
jgi:hypothetical protein